MAIEKGTEFRIEVQSAAIESLGVGDLDVDASNDELDIPSSTYARVRDRDEVVVMDAGSVTGITERARYFAKRGTSNAIELYTDPDFDTQIDLGGSIGTAAVDIIHYAFVDGETDAEIQFGGETVDTTTKGQAGWEAKFRPTRMVTINANGLAVWPSDEGVRRLWTVFTSDPPEMRIRIKEQDNESRYSGLYQVSEMQLTAGAKDVTRWSCTLESVKQVRYYPADRSTATAE